MPSKIRFLRDQVYETGGPGKGPRFPAGTTLTLSGVAKAIGSEVTKEWAEGFLQRWIKRGAAEDVSNESAADRKAAEEAAETARRDPSEAQRRVDALLALASENGVEVAASSSEEQIVAALTSAGVETPQA